MHVVRPALLRTCHYDLTSSSQRLNAVLLLSPFTGGETEAQSSQSMAEPGVHPSPSEHHILSLSLSSGCPSKCPLGLDSSACFSGSGAGS